MARKTVTIDGNEAVAYIAHKTNEVCAIYPITPSSNMGEWADEWSAQGRTNIWGTVPAVVEMQSEGGASAATHGALQSGSLTTTFTASQGLLLMIPTMFKVAGELTSTVFHVTARTVATHALSIFGDHSDIMAIRSTGFGLLGSGSVQEAMDMALIAQASTLAARVPFIHFFDGFRTSHEVQKIEQLTDDDIRALITDELVAAHRARAMSPDRPFLRGTAQNPDVFFQARESGNKFYDAAPGIIQAQMDIFAKLTVGAAYHLFDYVGPADAERVIVIMGSVPRSRTRQSNSSPRRARRSAWSRCACSGPFSIGHLHRGPAQDRQGHRGARSHQGARRHRRAALPGCAHRHRRNPASGKLPFAMPKLIGGRYGLSSKEFTPATSRRCSTSWLKKPSPKNHFTVGINDDVTHSSLDVDYGFSTEPDRRQALPVLRPGLRRHRGRQQELDQDHRRGDRNYAQGYFVYDSKKAGAVTVSHLRFGPDRSARAYLITRRTSWPATTGRSSSVRHARVRAAGRHLPAQQPYGKDEVWDHLPQGSAAADHRQEAEVLRHRRLRRWPRKPAWACASTPSCRPASSPSPACCPATRPSPDQEGHQEDLRQEGRGRRREELRGRRPDPGQPDEGEGARRRHRHPRTCRRPWPRKRPDFVQRVTADDDAGKGDLLPVSAFPVDGTWPHRHHQVGKAQHRPGDPGVGRAGSASSATSARWSARTPPSAPRSTTRRCWPGAPPPSSRGLQGRRVQGPEVHHPGGPRGLHRLRHLRRSLPGQGQEQTPSTRPSTWRPGAPARAERENYAFFLDLPEVDRTTGQARHGQGQQFLQPLFEYSGACAGCGETPYIKLLTQLFGDRAMIANATGCSSIYGGNLPTTPYTKNKDGRGPAWANSLFEDNAEFGLGYAPGHGQAERARQALLNRLAASCRRRAGHRHRSMPTRPRGRHQGAARARGRAQASWPAADRPPRPSGCSPWPTTWSRRACGSWAATAGPTTSATAARPRPGQGRNVNILVLDTEVYSNTGGQASKSTPMGAWPSSPWPASPRPRRIWA
jgi:pyruvate-ferredoxin/flavodoxin oxidoreductase